MLPSLDEGVPKTTFNRDCIWGPFFCNFGAISYVTSFGTTTPKVLVASPLSFLSFMMSSTLVRLDPSGLKAVTCKGWVITSNILVVPSEEAKVLPHFIFCLFYPRPPSQAFPLHCWRCPQSPLLKRMGSSYLNEKTLRHRSLSHSVSWLSLVSF